MKQISELELKLKDATTEIKYIMQRKRAASFKHLSGYSKSLIEEEYKNAVSKQMDIIMAMVEANLPEAEIAKVVKRATK